MRRRSHNSRIQGFIHTLLVFLLNNLFLGSLVFDCLICCVVGFGFGRMEGKKSTVSADSAKAKPSIASELFGSKESSAPGTKGYSAGSGSSGIFDAVFSNPATMPGRRNSQFDGLGTWRKEDHQVWNSKPAPSDSIFQNSSSEGNKDRNPLFAGDHGKVEPCFLGSSLFYGGQDICNPPSNPSGTNKYYKDDDDRDERDCASRGNWWQESLYY